MLWALQSFVQMSGVLSVIALLGVSLTDRAFNSLLLLTECCLHANGRVCSWNAMMLLLICGTTALGDWRNTLLR